MSVVTIHRHLAHAAMPQLHEWQVHFVSLPGRELRMSAMASHGAAVAAAGRANKLCSSINGPM